MVSWGTDVDLFAQIRKILEVKIGEDPYKDGKSLEWLLFIKSFLKIAK